MAPTADTDDNKKINVHVIASGHPTTSIQIHDDAEYGAYHRYSIGDSGGNQTYINFQKGPIKEVGPNGIFIEDLMAIAIHRLECFQEGDFACEENANALDHLRKSLQILNDRTAARQARGVEGTYQKESLDN